MNTTNIKKGLLLMALIVSFFTWGQKLPVGPQVTTFYSDAN